QAPPRRLEDASEDGSSSSSSSLYSSAYRAYRSSSSSSPSSNRSPFDGRSGVDAPSSSARRERSVLPLLYFSWRATFVCLALARPRPIGSTPSTTGRNGP